MLFGGLGGVIVFLSSGQANWQYVYLHASTNTISELRKVDVDVVTFGQYMQPTKRHMKVHDYVTPENFELWRQRALDIGFLYCASGPLVRSSYKAGEAFIENVIKKRARKNQTAMADTAGENSRSIHIYK